MDDLVFLAVAIALFAMSALYVRACAYLTGESSFSRDGANSGRA